MSSNNCIGVNMVILFDKRVRYVKEVKNHCLSHINSELQGFGVTRSGFEPCLPVSVERALFRRVRLVSRLKHRFSSLRYGPTWNRTPPTRFGGLRTSSLDGRNVAHHANWRPWKAYRLSLWCAYALFQNQTKVGHVALSAGGWLLQWRKQQNAASNSEIMHLQPKFYFCLYWNTRLVHNTPQSISRSPCIDHILISGLMIAVLVAGSVQKLVQALRFTHRPK